MFGTQEAVQPESAAPRFLVSVGGAEFHEYSGVLSDVVVDTVVDGADHFEITLTHPWDAEHVSFTDLDWGTFEPDTPVTIEMGYGEGSGSTEEVFSGQIETVEPAYPAQAAPNVVVTGYSPARKMMRGTNSRSWKQKSIGKIVTSVASDHLDSIDTENARRKLPRVFQDDQSDYAFVAQLAADYGFEFVTSGGEGYFRPNTGGSSPGPAVVELTYGQSLASFNVELTAPTHGEVEVRHWDEEKKKKIVASETNSEGEGKQVIRMPVDSKSEANAIAESKLSTLRVDCYGETFGIPAVVAGTVISVAGIDEKFAKNYYVTKSTHRIEGDSYTMSFEGMSVE